MDAARWQRAEEIFHRALELREQERDGYLRAVCGDDGDLLADVVSLLARVPGSHRFLNAPALEVAALSAGPAAAPAAGVSGIQVGDQVDHYLVLRQLGEGGMGVVFEAEDQRLGRRVALKVLRPDGADPMGRERLIREARLASGVVHPLICQVYTLGQLGSSPYIVMELVEGESLADRLARAPLPPFEALRLAVNVLEALAVLHGHGIVHRDLKPSNVFLGKRGLKLLDFGLARPVHAPSDATGQPVTAAGMVVGTPQYAAPEQLLGSPVDERADLFSAAVVAFEMLAGRPPFTGNSLAALTHAVLYEAPPVLTGSAAILAADRVLHRALAKRPDERYATAAQFGADLSSALGLVDSGQAVEARPILRLAVLPFRMLTPDPSTDYLGSSLADALASSLGGLESLVVRSTLQSARYSQPPLHLDRIAADLAVDVVLTGSLLVRPRQVRVTAELVAAPGGDVWWSYRTDTALTAVLELHDDLAHRVLAALPLSPRDQRAAPRPLPHNAKAFDLYLRGMQLRAEAGAWRQAYAFFVHSLEHDASFAAAWAERGRLERILGKYDKAFTLAQAESSLGLALSLDPDNGAAQHYYAQIEIDLGRVDAALSRLVYRAGQRRAEPHIYAGLVHACRYGGLLDASVAAHRVASRLDPTLPTSVLHTYYLQGDFARALDEAHRSSDPFEARLLGAMGRRDEALAAARREEGRFAPVPLLRAFSTAMRAALEGQAAEALAELARFDESRFLDGEGWFYVAEIYALLEMPERAFATLTRAVDAGFLCVSAFERDVYLAPLHSMAAWTPLLVRLTAAQTAVSREFDRSGGRALLGV